jgi:hypothetical protein
MQNKNLHPPISVPQVMVSSTFTDLQEHRAALIRSIHSHKLHANVMENDSARLVDIIDSSFQMVRDSAAYIGVISLKYGQTPECPKINPDRLSITELEFNEAQRLERPILLYIMCDEHQGRKSDFENDPEKLIKLNAFRERAKIASPGSSVHRIYAVFNSLQDFKDKLSSSLAELKNYLQSSDDKPYEENPPEQGSNRSINCSQRHHQEMELQLKNALEAFKGQPTVFLEPKLSLKREFNDEPNELHKLMERPSDTLIIAPPEFGLTCLGLHLQFEAFKKGNFWLYVDAKQTKGRKIVDHINKELLHYGQAQSDLKCIVLDSWNPGNFDHLTIVNNIANKCPNLPLIVLAEDSLLLDATGNLSKLNRDFAHLHLQALSKSAMRQLVANYNATKHIGNEDVLLSSVAEHLESINIHRTPLNCYTVLRVLDGSYNEKLLNKSKLLKAILFVLFTDHMSFSFLSNKPEVEECTFVLGCFCKELVIEARLWFDSSTFISNLREVCKSKCIVLNIDAMLDALIENKILIRHGNQMAFRHRFWVLYFAAEWMRHDDEFRKFILKDRNYVNYPEIIEFYAGIDGKRADAIQTLLTDLTALIDKVEKNIGIAASFDPLSPLLWNPSDEFIQKARNQIAEKVGPSNLPANIKDKHADRQYQSTAPYDQSIRKFLNDYSVLSLLNSIKATSRALRSSPFVDVELKHKVTSAILQGWEEISRVVFWISPILAKDGHAIHDGFALRLSDGFSANLDQRFKEIITCNPSNIVRILGGDLASKKVGPLLSECFQATDSMLQKHMIALFVATVRPEGWRDATLDYINLLNPRSFYLGDIFGSLTHEVMLGDLEHEEEPSLKRLTRAIISKREYAPKVSDDKEIPPNKLLSEENKLPIDQLLKGNQPKQRG